jgi:hypothetical protein
MLVVSGRQVKQLMTNEVSMDMFKLEVFLVMIIDRTIASETKTTIWVPMLQ